MLKKLKLLSLFVVAFAFATQAQELPAPSPFAKIHQRVGLTDIDIEYSRPSIKGREIFGGLLTEGKTWRTGANAPTLISLSKSATIGGVEVPQGTYSVFTRLTGTDWTLLLNSDVKASEGTFKDDLVIAEIPLQVHENEDVVETMVFSFINLSDDFAQLNFAWEKYTWSADIQVDSKEQAKKNIEEKMSEADLGFYPYHSSASYYLANNIELKKALEWSKKSVELNAQYWNVGTLAELYYVNGDKKNAIKTAKQSLELAKEVGDDAYVFKNQENIKKWSAEK